MKRVMAVTVMCAVMMLFVGSGMASYYYSAAFDEGTSVIVGQATEYDDEGLYDDNETYLQGSTGAAQIVAQLYDNETEYAPEGDYDLGDYPEEADE